MTNDAAAKPPAHYMPSSPGAFDYAELAQPDADKLRETAEAIRSFGRRMGQDIITIGALLVTVKKGLGHGRFLPWIEAEFAWDERTAQRYMQAAEAFGGESDTVSALPPTTIYQLSAPSTPQPVRAAVVERLARGERPSVEAIRSMIADAREADKRARADAKLTPEEKTKRKRAAERRERELSSSRHRMDVELRQEAAARREAAALIVERLGDDAGRVMALLEVARHLNAADLRSAISPSFVDKRIKALPA